MNYFTIFLATENHMRFFQIGKHEISQAGVEKAVIHMEVVSIRWDPLVRTNKRLAGELAISIGQERCYKVLLGLSWCHLIAEPSLKF